MSKETKQRVPCQIWGKTNDIILKVQKQFKKKGIDLTKSATIHKLITEGAKKVGKK